MDHGSMRLQIPLFFFGSSILPKFAKSCAHGDRTKRLASKSESKQNNKIIYRLGYHRLSSKQQVYRKLFNHAASRSRGAFPIPARAHQRPQWNRSEIGEPQSNTVMVIVTPYSIPIDNVIVAQPTALLTIPAKKAPTNNPAASAIFITP